MVSKSKNAAFTEAGAWRDVGGWQPLFGNFRGAGYSIEWHDFFAKREFDWAASFHPGCVELCLNLDGHGFVKNNDTRQNSRQTRLDSTIAKPNRSRRNARRASNTNFSRWNFPAHSSQNI